MISMLTGSNPFYREPKKDLKTMYMEHVNGTLDLDATTALDLRAFELSFMIENYDLDFVLDENTTNIMPGVPDFILERQMDVEHLQELSAKQKARKAAKGGGGSATVQDHYSGKHEVHLHPDFKKELESGKHKGNKVVRQHVHDLATDISKNGHENTTVNPTKNERTSTTDHPNPVVNTARKIHRAKNMYHSHAVPRGQRGSSDHPVHYGHVQHKDGSRTYHILGVAGHGKAGSGSMDREMASNKINSRANAIKEAFTKLFGLKLL